MSVVSKSIDLREAVKERYGRLAFRLPLTNSLRRIEEIPEPR